MMTSTFTLICLPPAMGTWEALANAFGITAAILTVGGIVLLRFQRNRHEYNLMRAAVEKGASDLVFSTPPWLLSLRQGLLTLTLGAGLIGIGAVAWALTPSPFQLPWPAASQPASISPAELLEGPKPRDERGRLTSEGRLYSLARDHYNRAQNQKLAGQIMLAAGALLVLLGAVRMAFARVEFKAFDDGA